MKCPACSQALVVVERESIEVDWCPRCRGIWFDAGELELLAEKAGRDLAPGALGQVADAAVRERRRRCPRCRRKMTKMELPGDGPVIVDRCAEHGIWFDAGELGSMMRSLADQREPSAHVVTFLGETFRHASARHRAADCE